MPGPGAVKIEPMDQECYPECKEYKNYPYGTNLEFTGDLAEALNVDDYSAGDLVEVRALAFVKRKSEDSEGDGDVEKEFRLQLTEVNLTKASSNPGRIEVLYGD